MGSGQYDVAWLMDALLFTHHTALSGTSSIRGPGALWILQIACPCGDPYRLFHQSTWEQVEVGAAVPPLASELQSTLTCLHALASNLYVMVSLFSEWLRHVKFLASSADKMAHMWEV